MKSAFRFAFIEFLETVFDYKKIAEYSAELRSLSDFFYLCFSLLRGRQTPGEEYTSIAPYSEKHSKYAAFPGLKRRLGYAITSVLGPYFFSKGLRAIK